MEKLSKAGIVGRIGLIVTKRGDVLLAGPVIDVLRRGKLCGIDVDDRGVGGAEFFAMPVGLSVDLLGDIETGTSSLGKADQFFEPCCSGSLKVNTCACASDGLVDGL